MNDIRTFDALNPENVVSFHGIAVNRLLSEDELADMHSTGNGFHAPFFPGGSPERPFQ